MNKIKKWNAIIIAFILVFYQLIGIGHHAQAAFLENAVMISVQDISGKEVLPLTAVPIKNGETAYDVLEEAAKTAKVDLESHDSGSLGKLIDSIGGIKPDYNADQSFWGFIVNGAFASTGVSSYAVKNGDDILFKVIKGEPKTVKTTVSIDGDGVDSKYKNKSVSVIEGSNAYDAIKQAYADSQIDAPIDSQYFAYIADIDHIIKSGQYFGVYFNGVSATVGVSSYKVENGDNISLKVTGTADEGTGGGAGSDPGKGSGDKGNHSAVPVDQLNKVIEQASQYVLKKGVHDPFEAMGLRQAGISIPSSFVNQLAQELSANNGQYRNVTDYEKMALGITTAGGDATHFAGYNLIEKIYNNSRMTNQGNNGPIYALLALDSGQYKVPDNALWSRPKLVQYLLDQQLKDGSWALYGSTGSPDITGMALSALAPYKTDPKVKSAIDKAVTWLSAEQNESGGYGVASNGGDSSESTAQVIIGLTASGIDPTGSEFTKSGGQLITHLLAFVQKDGGFAHLLSDQHSDDIATSQALMALTAYKKFLNGNGSGLQFDNSGLTVQPSVDGAKNVLPNTATNDYNWIALGAVLMLLGAFALVLYRRRRV
ncbi:MAG: DUF4430 domain-containing protein [Tuberibacillus sp.]